MFVCLGAETQYALQCIKAFRSLTISLFTFILLVDKWHRLDFLSVRCTDWAVFACVRVSLRMSAYLCA